MAHVFGVKEGSRTLKVLSSILGSKCHPPDQCRSGTYVVCQTVLERRCSAALSAITEQLFCVSCRWQARWKCLLCLVQPTVCSLDGPRGCPVLMVGFSCWHEWVFWKLAMLLRVSTLKSLAFLRMLNEKDQASFLLRSWVIMKFSNQKLVFLLPHPWLQLFSMLSAGFLPFTSVDACS